MNIAFHIARGATRGIIYGLYEIYLRRKLARSSVAAAEVVDAELVEEPGGCQETQNAMSNKTPNNMRRIQ